MTGQGLDREAVGDPGTSDAWGRYGWLLGAIWLVFIVFPLHASLAAPAPGRWVGVALVVAFAVLYLHGLWVDGRPEAAVLPSLTWYVGILVVLALATVPVIGASALGLVPFILSVCGMALRPRLALASLAVALGVLVGVIVVTGEVGLAFFGLIYAMVTLTLVLVSSLDRSAEEQRRSAGRLALSEERERVARDVHDVLGHSLTVVTVKAELAERLVDIDPERAKAELAELRSITRQSLAEIRATVAGLRVARLSDELDAARAALSGAGVELDVEGECEGVDPRHRIALAWAVRELATNVVRHSDAERCRIVLREDGLVVTDDGRGLRGRREGNGIRGLRERVEPAGGRVTVEDAGPGTRVVVQL